MEYYELPVWRKFCPKWCRYYNTECSRECEDHIENAAKTVNKRKREKKDDK